MGCPFLLLLHPLLKNLICILSGVECDDTIDWVTTPLAFVRSINPPTEYVPCNLQWSNLQMLMSDQSCIRFTAASAGPIYFALSAVPSLPETWYYLRIARVCKLSWTKLTLILVSSGWSFCVQRDSIDDRTRCFWCCRLGGSQHLPIIHRLFRVRTNSWRHLEDKTDLWKSGCRYVKCLTWDLINFCFLDATFNHDTVLNTYLVYEDDKPIQPSFYSFGSGQFKVQVKKVQSTCVFLLSRLWTSRT